VNPASDDDMIDKSSGAIRLAQETDRSIESDDENAE